MKSDDSNFAAVVALLATLATGSAGATEMEYSLTDCRAESSTPAIDSYEHCIEDEEGNKVACTPTDYHRPASSGGATICRVLTVVTDGLVTLAPTTCTSGDPRIPDALISATGSGYVEIKQYNAATPNNVDSQKKGFGNQGDLVSDGSNGYRFCL